MSEIIEYNFGKEDREHVHKFCRLLGLLESHEAAVKADPVKYLNQAGAEIARLRTEIFAAWEVVALTRCAVVRPSYEMPELPKAVYVDEKELLALREVYRRVTRLAGMSS